MIILQSVKRPIAVMAIVLMILLFGLLALKSIPIQLTPDINKPIIQITTIWPGTSPLEIEREIISQQEEVLKGLEGLETMIASATTGRAEITLEFDLNQDMNKALLLVANRLDRVTDYPEEVDEPFLNTSGSDDSPIAWIVLKKTKPSATPIENFGSYTKDVIQEFLERTPGVERINVFGGADLEIQAIVEAEQLAKYQLTISDVISTLRENKTSLSAGDINEGKRRYVIRTEAEFTTLDQINNLVLKTIVDPQTKTINRIKVSDIATIKWGYKEPTAKMRQLGTPTIALNAIREKGANVIETMAELKKNINILNQDILPTQGLQLKQVYDETDYINSAIDLVQKNIIIGGLLAATILWLFLRSKKATLIISLSIPVSIIGSFVAMAAIGRSINVISLAGLAFAVGMVVDAAIITLENIYRYRSEGKPAPTAALVGTKEVWGAIFVSALTTVMVFIPILTMKLEVGQLFRDIAVAISVSVILSLIVAITVIPALSSKILIQPIVKEPSKKFTLLDQYAKQFANKLLSLVEQFIQHKTTAAYTVISITVVAVTSAIVFLPKLEYLPQGNRNLVFGIIRPPPGYNLETTFDIAHRIENEISPLWQKEIKDQDPKYQHLPSIKNFFFVARNNLTFLGASSHDPKRVKELIPILRNPIFQEPGTFGFIQQTSLFGRSLGSGRVIDIDISGRDLNEILSIAKKMIIDIETIFPRQAGNQYQPIPGVELGAPEVRILPKPDKIADNELSNSELAIAIKALNDGFRIAEVTDGSRRFDLTLQGPEAHIRHTQGIANLPILTPKGDIIPVANLAEVKLTAGPTEIRHKDKVRTVTIQLQPSPTLPLEIAMEMITKDIITPFKENNDKQDVSINLSGTADELTKTWNAMMIDLIVAIIIVYLVMVILFEDFFLPFIILFSVPIAAAGGILGLSLLNLFTYQPLDMLTLLGFIILIGIVVNNAILIVHHTRLFITQEKLAPQQAILLSVSHRIRPIFMSTLTSLFGMFPLVLFPGAGSELYRGLGSVVLGGLSLSALLTLIIIPALLSLFYANWKTS